MALLLVVACIVNTALTFYMLAYVRRYERQQNDLTVRMQQLDYDVAHISRHEDATED